MTTKFKWLLSALALLGVANLIYHIIGGWGTISVNFHNAPAKRVFAELGKQAGTAFITNLDPETPVSLTLKRASLQEAIDSLAISTETRPGLFYIVAPNKQQLAQGKAALIAGRRDSTGWQWHSHPLPMALQMVTDSLPYDSSRQQWLPAEAPANNELNTILDSFSLYTDCSFINPETWNPTLKQIPANGGVESAVKKVSSLAGGKIEKVFYFRGQQRNFAQAPANNQPAGDGERRPRGEFNRGDNQFQMEGAWLDARIAQLPANVQPEAKQAVALMQELRQLPPDQRRTRMEQLMNDPVMQEKREERQLERDAKTPAEKRAARYSRYVASKASRPEH